MSRSKGAFGGYERLLGVYERFAVDIERIIGLIERLSRFNERLAMFNERLAGKLERLSCFIERQRDRLHFYSINNSSKKLTVSVVTTNIDSNRINSYTDDVENTFIQDWKENGELG